MCTLEVAFSKYNHTASKGSLIIYKYFIITDVNLHSIFLFVGMCICVLRMFTYVLVLLGM